MRKPKLCLLPNLILMNTEIYKPYKAIEVDLDTLETYFVTAFPKSKTRQQLFENYLRFIYRFQDEVWRILILPDTKISEIKK